MGCCSFCLNGIDESMSFISNSVRSIDQMIPLPSKIGGPLYIVLDGLSFTARLSKSILELLV